MTEKGKKLIESFTEWVKSLDDGFYKIREWQFLDHQKQRGVDKHGSGEYGASRGSRIHEGIDIETMPLEVIKAPFNGRILREARPDLKDHLTGVLLQADTGERVKIFYMKPHHISGLIKKGDDLGIAQSINHRYPGITEHIHVEIEVNGKKQNPEKYLKL